MFGRDIARTFAYPSQCKTALSPDSVPRLRQKWFYKTADVVTATPAIADDTAFVGDWSGKFYALSLADGRIRWTFSAPPQKNVYSGQIVASAAVADVGGERRVFFASGKTIYALGAADGTLRWKHELNPAGGADDFTEIQSSPVIADGMVIVGYDGHDNPARAPAWSRSTPAPGGNAGTSTPIAAGRRPDAEACGARPRSTPRARLVFAGTANCPSSPNGWNAYSEAIFAVDLDTGVPKWSFQPRGPSNNDFDFAGAPNLFGRTDARSSASAARTASTTRSTGSPASSCGRRPRPRPACSRRTTRPVASSARPRSTTAWWSAARRSAVRARACTGSTPKTGAIAWQQSEAAPTFAPSAIVNGVAFSGSTTDFTLRAVDLRTGKVLWSQQLAGGIAGGVAVSGDVVVAVAGIREPGVEAAGTDSGVYAFALGPAGGPSTTDAPKGTLPPTTKAPPPTAPDPNAPPGRRCVGHRARWTSR